MKGKQIVSIVSVFAAGIAIGLLVAPRKGTKTRKRIKNAVMDCVEQVSQFLGKGDIPDVEENSTKINPVM